MRTSELRALAALINKVAKEGSDTNDILLKKVQIPNGENLETLTTYSRIKDTLAITNKKSDFLQAMLDNTSARKRDFSVNCAEEVDCVMVTAGNLFMEMNGKKGVSYYISPVTGKTNDNAKIGPGGENIPTVVKAVYAKGFDLAKISETGADEISRKPILEEGGRQKYNYNFTDFCKDVLTGKVEIRVSGLDALKEKYGKSLIEKDGKDFFAVSDANWNLVQAVIEMGSNAILLGPTGCGKTDLIQKAAAARGITEENGRFYCFAISNIQNSENQIQGTHVLNENGASEFRLSDFAKFLKRVAEHPDEKFVLILDEINRAADATTSNMLMELCDHRRRLTISQDVSKDGANKEIKVGKNLSIFATANIGAEYSDTNALDDALRSRFAVKIRVDYPSVETETKILMNRTGVSEKDARAIAKKADKVRRLDVDVMPSTRETIAMAQFVAFGFGVNDAFMHIMGDLDTSATSRGESDYNTVLHTIENID